MSDSFYSPFINKEGRKLTIAEICFSDVEVMVAKQLEEGYQLEFKREVSSTVKRRFQILLHRLPMKWAGG